MTLEELQKIAEKDMKLDNDNLDIESLKIPELQHKYLKFYYNINLLSKKAEIDYKILYREKWEYYSGKSTEPARLKLLKQDLPIYLESDEELLNLKGKLDYYKIMVNYLKDVLESLNNRGFQINNAIRWKQFTEGLN